MNLRIKQNSSKLFYEGACGSTQLKDDRANRFSLTALLSQFTRVFNMPNLCLALFVGVSGQAIAQDAAMDEVTVTGFKQSIRDAIELKQDSDSIIEAISAEDIGKLPDVSIAESLGRLPGLASQRLNGRSQVISVRGLSPDFTTTLFNGRQQVSVGDNRGVEYDQYPSGLIDSVLVYKTPDAALLGQGLAGTVDLRTIRPLEYGERAVSVTGRYIQNDKDALNPDGDNQGQRANFFYVDQFAEETLGFAIGISHLSNPSQGEQHRIWGYPGPAATTPPTDPAGKHVAGGIDSLVRTSELERNSVMGIVEWQPNDRFSTALDIYYSDFQEENLLRGVEFGLQWGQGALQPGYKVDGDFVSSGQYNGQGILVRNDVETRESDLLALGWNLEYDVGDWTTVADLSYSRAEKKDQIIESYAGQCNNADTGAASAGTACKPNVSFTSSSEGVRVYPKDGDGKPIDYGKFGTTYNAANPGGIFLTSPFGWGGDKVPGGQVGYLNEPEITDVLKQITLSAERDFDTAFFSNIDMGINLNNRKKTKDANEWFLSLGADNARQKALPTTGQVTALDHIGLPGGIATYDPRDLLSNTYQRISNTDDDVSAAKNWTVEEDVVQPYVKLGIDTAVQNIGISGNVGLQVVFTDQSSTAPAAGPAIGGTGILGTTSGSTEYTDFLPSLNLNFALNEYHNIRFGAARTLARSRMDELRASQELELDFQDISVVTPNDQQRFWFAKGGNPELEPWRANAVDMSYEFYFPNKTGYFSVAGHYKDLNSWVYTSQEAYDFSALVPTIESGIAEAKRREAARLAADPSAAPTEITLSDGTKLNLADFPDTPETTIGGYEAPRNGIGGSVSGIEFSLSLNGDLFHESLAPFGVILNYSLTDSSVQTTAGSKKIDLPGLSEKIANATLFYEQAGFAARVAVRYRSDYIGEIQGFGAGREFKRVDDETVVDAQISYEFPQNSVLNGLSLFVQGTNLNDEPFVTYSNDNRREVVDYQEYGPTYLFGFGYNFF